MDDTRPVEHARRAPHSRLARHRRVCAPLVTLLGTLSLLLLAVPSTRAQPSIQAADRAVLKAFYTATNGPNWQYKTNWDTIDTAPWLYGVFVDTDGRVTGIRLDGNRLSGQLPDLSALTRLTTLTLHNNHLTGPLPNLPPSLTTLSLHTNQQLSGTLADLSALTNLTTLTLYNSRLSGTLDGLSALPRLTTLSLHTNQLHGPIPDLSSLSGLTELDLSNNQLHGRLDGLSALTNLTHLHLHNNQLSGKLDGLSALTHLTTLDLHSNKLSGNLNALSALTHLTTLTLHTNELTEPLPDLSALTHLTTLHLHNNQLSGSLPSLPPSLTTLTLHSNQLTGKIPAELGSLTALTTLTLHTNHLRGPIPDLSGLTGLTALNLSTNELGLNEEGEQIANPLTGLANKLPASSLTELNLSTNQLSGPLPDLSSLSGLTALDLSTNQLGLNEHGEQIAAPLTGLASKLPASSLQGLWLSNNQLSGPIPDLSSLAGLRLLYLQDNALTGSVPVPSPYLAALFLHNNRLSGALERLGGQSFLRQLSLYDNPRGSPSTLYGYPTDMLEMSEGSGLRGKYMRLFAPGNGDPVCLPTTEDGPDCIVPPGVDRLRLRAHPTGFTATWEPQPADAAPRGYEAWYSSTDLSRTMVSIYDLSWTVVPTTGTTATVTGLTPGAQYDFIVKATGVLPWLRATVTLPQLPPPPPPPPPGPPDGDNGGDNGGDNSGDNGGDNGGGGGGGTRTPDDQHGGTPDEATTLTPAGHTGALSRTLTAHLQSRRDVDYFTLDLPYAGVLTASTTGADTIGRLYQAQGDDAPLLVAEDMESGAGSNFALGVAVAPGTYYLAVSAGRGSGEYRLSVHYTPAFVDNPGPDSLQSGISVLSGWVCEAATVEIELVPASGTPQTWVPATHTSRADTAGVCGAETTDTGFGLLFNWNLLGDGTHTVRVLIDDVVLAERQITVTTLGAHPDQEFRRGLRHTTEVADFPAVGETTTLRWQEARQNFMIASGAGGGGGEQVTPAQAWLGNPAPGSFQSGIGVLSGWVCEADTVELVFETAPGPTFTEEAGYGTERLDTAGVCGDTDNGFGAVVELEPAG